MISWPITENITDEYAKILENKFSNLVEIIEKAIGPKAFRPRSTVNAAVVDSVMVGVADRLDQGAISSYSDLSNAYDLLLDNDLYYNSVNRATADEENVRKRLELASRAFRSVA